MYTFKKHSNCFATATVLIHSHPCPAAAAAAVFSKENSDKIINQLEKMWELHSNKIKSDILIGNSPFLVMLDCVYMICKGNKDTFTWVTLCVGLLHYLGPHFILNTKTYKYFLHNKNDPCC